MVVGGSFELLLESKHAPQCPSTVSLEEIQISTVVPGLQSDRRHVQFGGKSQGFVVPFVGTIELVQCRERHPCIQRSCQQTLTVTDPVQDRKRPLVAIQCFVISVQPVVGLSQVDIESCEAGFFPGFFKQCPRSPSALE